MDADGDSAEKHLEFYGEYLSVLALTEEFYSNRGHGVPAPPVAQGELTYRGRPVRPEKIRDIGLLTVEGEDYDISGSGRTQAAHDLCFKLPEAFKDDYVQPHVGHYGVFNGLRVREEIYTRARAFVRRMQTGLNKRAAAA